MNEPVKHTTETTVRTIKRHMFAAADIERMVIRSLGLEAAPSYAIDVTWDTSSEGLVRGLEVRHTDETVQEER